MKETLRTIIGKKTNYGFDWGGASITRLFSDVKKGWVVIGLKTKKEDLQIYVTKTGKVRIHSANRKEWFPK